MVKNSKAFFKTACQLPVENDVGTCNKQFAESPTIWSNDGAWGGGGQQVAKFSVPEWVI
jgi:hypothetical protein